MSIRDYLFTNYRQDVYKSKTFKDFIKKYPIFERYAGGWMEKDFEAIKVRQEKSPEHYTTRTIHMPEALEFSDIFESIRLTEGNEGQGEYFLSTRCDNLKDGWQEGKFIHAYVKPTQKVLDIQKRISGWEISSFELIQRDNEYLITIRDKTDIGSMYGLWIAIVYDVPKELKGE